MKFTLKDYQQDAVRDCLFNLAKSRRLWRAEGDKTAFSLTAVTGAGKTVMATAAFEALFHGDDEMNFDADPGAVVIWFSDDPSLNEQTRFRIMEASDRINHTDLIVVENTFNRSKFEAGKVYFLNTQKLGKNSLLVRGQDLQELQGRAGDLLPETRPDLRSFTIWDTIQNTIEDPDLTLYLVLDEAHRGMASSNAVGQRDKSTIVQRLINGAGSVPGIPVVWGISATVDRFDRAMESSTSHMKLRNVVVDALKVQESGLIKDTILLDIPDEAGDFDTVLVRRGAAKLRESTAAWAEYAQQQDEPHSVVPLMVLQIPNTPNADDVGRWLGVIFEQFPELPHGCIANVLGERTSQRYGNRDVPYIEPQRVQESTWVRVLIAKDAISTGWDCPRAEVMVSFRSANDQTHITQLLGRMIRSPLARRIPGNDRLNSVECLLPKFNRRAVETVVDALAQGGDMMPPTPGRILIDYVEVRPNPAAEVGVWEIFEALPSQTRPQRGAKPAKRLTALAHELASDDILAGAGRIAHGVVHTALDEFQASHAETIKAKREAVMTVDGRTVVARLGAGEKTFEQFVEAADMAVIADAYRRAARVISPDIARSYVDHLASMMADRDADPEAFLDAIYEARINVAGLGLATELQSVVDTTADALAREWLVAYRPAIKALSDDRKEVYRQVAEMSVEPQDVPLVKPASRFEPTKVKTGDTVTPITTWPGHLLCDEAGRYPASLNEWERAVVETECARPGARFWYRNPQYPGQSSLGIAYRVSDEWKVLRPDFVFFAADHGETVADLVDPHGVHLADALPKLQGLAVYAEVFDASYRRIEAVAAAHGKLRRLDLKQADVRTAVYRATDAAGLFAGPFASDYE